MESNLIASELIGLEKKYWQAMQDHDLDTALSLTDFPCLVAGTHGAMLVEKEAYKKMFDSHRDDEFTVKFTKQPQVRMVGPDTAVIAYEVESDMLIGGKREKQAMVDTSTWVRRDGKWACAHHTETPLAKQ